MRLDDNWSESGWSACFLASWSLGRCLHKPQLLIEEIIIRQISASLAAVNECECGAAAAGCPQRQFHPPVKWIPFFTSL